MEFKINYLNRISFYFYQTALYLAVEKENIEIIKLLLSNNKLNINILNISSHFFYTIKSQIFQIKFKITYFNAIQIAYFNLIQIIYFNEIQNHMFR